MPTEDYERYLPFADLDAFAEFYETLQPEAQVATVQLHEAVSGRLEGLRARVHQEEGFHRQVFRLTEGTDERMYKSSRSARSKVLRELEERDRKGSLKRGETLTKNEIETILLGFPDLGRFRVVCDYLSDMDRAIGEILDSGRVVCLDQFQVRGYKDHILDRKFRRGGHRARQFSVEIPGGARKYAVEIQLMTRLQETWDQRNHPFYEATREGHELSDELHISDLAISETLYLLDRQADENWKQFLLSRRGTP